MQSVQTIILQTAPDSSIGNWDLAKLKETISNDKQRAHAAGKNLGMKLNLASEPNTLAVEGRYCQAKRRDMNDPQWLAWQTCWKCGKFGHICQCCMESYAEREAYQMKKMVE